jgi:non-ribosomal peptide synthetase component F
MQYSGDNALKEMPTTATGKDLQSLWAKIFNGVDDVLFGVTLSGRTAPVTGITEMIAPTLTIVPVRIYMERTQTVSEFLESVQKQAIEMMPYEQTGIKRSWNSCQK